MDLDGQAAPKTWSVFMADDEKATNETSTEQKQKEPFKEGDYNESMIQELEGVEHVRKRPGMYIGDTTARGLHHLVYEIVDNSIDEAEGGVCHSILIKINADGS